MASQKIVQAFRDKLKAYLTKFDYEKYYSDTFKNIDKIELPCKICQTKITPIITNLLKFPDRPPRCRSCAGKASLTPKAIAKKETTMLKKYGVKNANQSEIIKAKIKKTNLKRYGKGGPQAIARFAFKEKYGVANPFELEAIKEKIKKTNIKKYGGVNKKRGELLKRNNVNSEKELFNKLVTFLESNNTHCNSELAKNEFGTAGVVLTRLLNKFGRKDLLWKENSTSRQELEIYDYLLTLLPKKDIVRNSRAVITPLELDFYLPKHKIAIEFNGLYWHSTEHKEKDYHFKKRELCEKQGIILIQIHEDEWDQKLEIVKSLIKSKLGLNSTKIFARKTQVRKVENREANKFLEQNHLMGKFISCKFIGLYFEDSLVALLGYKSTKDGGIDISRFCNKCDTQVVGGLSRLISRLRILEDNCRYIQSWVDLRYGTGYSLKRLGFTMNKVTQGWGWTDFKNVFNRLKCRANMDIRGLSEAEYADELGWVKIYDAGQALFTKML